jgi:hypothetical protein
MENFPKSNRQIALYFDKVFYYNDGMDWFIIYREGIRLCGQIKNKRKVSDG